MYKCTHRQSMGYWATVTQILEAQFRYRHEKYYWLSFRKQGLESIFDRFFEEGGFKKEGSGFRNMTYVDIPQSKKKREVKVRLPFLTLGFNLKVENHYAGIMPLLEHNEMFDLNALDMVFRLGKFPEEVKRENEEYKQKTKQVLDSLKSIKEGISQKGIDYPSIKQNLEKQADGQVFIQYLTKEGVPTGGMYSQSRWEYSESKHQLIRLGRSEENDVLAFGGRDGGLIARIRENQTGVSDYDEPQVIEVWDNAYNLLCKESMFNVFALDMIGRMRAIFRI